MDVHAPADRAFVEQQNQFRGLVAEFNSRKFEIDPAVPRSRQLRRRMRELLLNARATLQPWQFDAFLEWANHQTESQLGKLAMVPIAFEELTGVITVPPVTLEQELIWITARINADLPRLALFRSAAIQIEHLIFDGKFEDAITALGFVELKLGVSLWSVQLRVSLEQLAGGLERQKRYTASVRSVYKRGLLGFIVYHTSVRNEERTTLGKFAEDIKVRIERHKYYTPPIQTYLRYRLAGEWPSTEAGLADILRLEQSHSIIDVYETFIALVQELGRHDDLDTAREVAAKCLRSIPFDLDYRLQKTAMVLDRLPVESRPNARSRSISDALFRGNAKLAALRSRRIFNGPDPIDPWQLIYSGFALAHTARFREDDYGRPQSAPRLIGLIQRRCEVSAEAFAQLEKLCHNLRGLPCAVALIDMLHELRRSRPDQIWRSWLIGMNSSSLGIEDVPANSAPLLDQLLEKEPGPTLTAWRNFHGVNTENEGVSKAAIAVFAAAGMVRKKSYNDAVQSLTQTAQLPSIEPLRNIAAALLLHANFALGDRQRVIELVADEGARSASSSYFLPVTATLGDYSWADYNLVAAPLVVPIALDLLWNKTQSDLTASRLRFSTGAFLRRSEVDRPSKLFDRATQYPLHQLVYFLRKVCIPHVLDVSRVLKSTREVMEERQAVCASLRLLDPSNAADYEIEVMNITNQLALVEGQWIVDRTRIHVDVEALTRWASRELSEDFARYQDLVPVSVGTEQNFDDVLKEIATTSPGTRQPFVPENESDAVLFSILCRLGDEFLINPSFGLDFCLSKRIRHQSFIGFIRGPLEFSNLITTRESEGGPYHRNDFWLQKFSNSSDEVKLDLNRALTTFATKFDELLIEAKDNQFHVYSDEKQSGLIYLDLSSQLMTLTRAVVRLDYNFSEFMLTAIAILWGALEPSLAKTRRFISESLKTKIAEGFDELRATARRVAEQDPSFLEFDMEIGLRSTQVQRALDDAATWFSRANIEAHKRYFTLEQAVNIAIDSALKCQRAFEPIINREIEGDLQVTASSLIFVHDVFFVALDNVRAHSGIKKPNVTLTVLADVDKGTLNIQVVSDVKPQNRRTQEKDIEEIQQLIDAGTVGRLTRREGRSGFLKLAAVVRQSSKGLLEFGFTDDGRFRLAVTYSLITTPANEEALICD